MYLLFLVALCALALPLGRCGSVYNGHFPGMQSVMEREPEMFQGMHEADADGFYRHEVHVTGASGRAFDMKYEGKFKTTNLFHNLENDVHLRNFGCTDKAVILKYDSRRAAQFVYLKLARAPHGMKHVLLTGRQLWKCPPSWNSVPEFDSDTKTFGKKNDPNAYQPMEGIRRVTRARLVEGKEKQVIVETERGLITDVFEHLELEGSTNMMPGGGMISGPNQVKVIRLEDDRASAMESDYLGASTDDMVEPDWVSLKKAFNKFKKGVKKLARVVVKKVIKPVVKVMKRTALKVISVAKQPRKWLQFIGGRNLLFYVLRPITKLLPVLSKTGSFRISKNFELNYNHQTGRATRILTLGNMNNVDKTRFRSAAEFTMFVRNEIQKKNKKLAKKNEQKAGQNGKNTGQGKKEKKPAVGSGKVMYDINLFCLNCFVRFTDNRVHWKLSIGGAKLATIRMDISSLVELMVEFYAQVTLTYEYTIPLGEYPIPFVSIPFGPYTLGFALQGDFTIGVNFKTPMFYYKHHYIGRQSIGYEHSLLGGGRWHHSGSTVRNDKFGPIVFTRVAVGVFVQPSISLVFSDIALVAGGVVPNIEFALVPVKRTDRRCTIEFQVTFRIPVVVGVWVGFKAGSGLMNLYSKSKTISFLPIPKPLLSGCVSSRDFTWFGSQYGQPITAEVALPKGVRIPVPPARVARRKARNPRRKNVTNKPTKNPVRSPTKFPTKNPTRNAVKMPNGRKKSDLNAPTGGVSESEDESSESKIVREIVIDEADVHVGQFGYLAGFLGQYQDGVVAGVGLLFGAFLLLAVWMVKRRGGNEMTVLDGGKWRSGKGYGAIGN